MNESAIPLEQPQKPPNFEPQLVRSNLLLNADRYVLEQDIMCQLEAGKGPLGLIMIDLEQKKREVCKIDKEKPLPKHKDMLKKLGFDGVYVNDPEVNQKFNDINVQKLEERLLNNKMSEFFHLNGELKLDNDLLLDQITRPADLAFEQTMAFQTKEVNAILSDRMNAFKKKYFRLDVIVGKLELFNCEDLFCEEDILCLRLKEQFVDYENKVSLAMIPFYQQRLEHLNIRIQQERNNEDLIFLEKTLKEVSENLENEKKEVQELAQKLYNTWVEISDLRSKQNFASASAHLKVYKRDIGGQVEFSFALVNMNPSEETDNHEPLPAEVSARRGKVERIRAFCKLYINGKYVSQTKKQPVKYPIFEVELCEVFQVNLFTMPSSIQLALYLNKGISDKLIDVMDIEVPGQHVKSLTCACQLIQEIKFSKLEHMQRIQKGKNKLQEIENKKEEEMNDKEKQEKKLKDEQAYKNEVKGQIFVKAVWQGNGPKMPPIKSENLFKKQKAHKNRKMFTLEEETLMLLKELYIDVNDPRNEGIIKILKEQKNEFFIKLLHDDSKNLLADVKPFRHRLLQLRAKDAELANIPIPFLENEIIDSSRSTYFLDKLEKLFRDEAYHEHLKARIQEKQKDPENTQTDISTDHNVIDLETLRRRQLIFDQLKNRQQNQSLDGQRGYIQYKSVVKEVEMEQKNPLQAIFSKIFIGGRKLKPVVRKRTAVAFESVSESSIHVHVIKGENVPLRRDFLDQYRQFLGRDNKVIRGDNRAAIQRNNIQGNFNRQQAQEDNIEDRQKGLEFLDKNELYKLPQVESYVEVKVIFKDGRTIIDRTFCDDGKDPNWNEVKSFPFKPINTEKFTKDQLFEDDTKICITLFDRQKYQQQQEGKLITQEEHRYLGSATVPLRTVLLNPGKMEFNFKLTKPIVLPSYNVVQKEIYFVTTEQEIDEQKLRENEQIPTYINLSISLEPPLELPSENEQEYYPGQERAALLQYGSQWVSQNRKYFKNSRLKVFGENIHGQSVLLCRFLTPIQPPEKIWSQSDDFAIEKAARFVSMIPFVDDLSMFKNMPDVYSTSQEFLDLGAGDYEEHAILLCNYFNFIDEKQNPGKYISYIVYGEAYPEGNSVYVMRKLAKPINNHSIELWGPLSGECYYFKYTKPSNTGICIPDSLGFMELGRINDPICPMRKIHGIVSSDNIWVNCQVNENPVLIDFNIENLKAWKPIFSGKKILEFYQGGLIPTYQKLENGTELIYAQPMQNIQSLETRIQKFIVEMFQDERIKHVRKTTKWRFECGSDLRLILVACEEQSNMARKGGKSSEFRKKDVSVTGSQVMNTEMDLQGIINRMDKLSSDNDKNKRVWGFPLNSTFTSLDQLWKQVETTKVHMVNRHDVEFAICVYIRPYPANVLSVWIYLAAFVDKSLEELSRV